jgi:hypothetical protein
VREGLYDHTILASFGPNFFLTVPLKALLLGTAIVGWLLLCPLRWRAGSVLGLIRDHLYGDESIVEQLRLGLAAIVSPGSGALARQWL